jgi:hypothetical protein
MSEVQLAIAHAVKLALVAALAGVVVRGRAPLCWSFGAYVLAILAGNSLVSLWPERFYNPAFWVLKQGVYDALKLLVALELAWRAFSAFPGALWTVRLVLVPLVAASTLGVALLTPLSSYRQVWEWQPAVSTATLWALTLSALVVVWYQVPVDAWQKAIMMGLATYLLVFVALVDLLGRHGWLHRGLIAGVDTVAYLALVCFWAWASWRPRPEAFPGAGPAPQVR